MEEMEMPKNKTKLLQELFHIITELVEPEAIAARKVNHRRSSTELASQQKSGVPPPTLPPART